MRELFEDEEKNIGHILSRGGNGGKGAAGRGRRRPAKNSGDARAELQRARADLDAGLLNTPDRGAAAAGCAAAARGAARDALSGEARALRRHRHGRRLLAGKAKGGGGKGRGGKGGKSAFAAGVAKDGGRPFGRQFDQRRHQLAAATCGDTFIHWQATVRVLETT